jgi:endogenous inhibitor of DNA gyrase (YacG/DUF329 family)
MARCPTCDRAVRRRDENDAFPSCSPRCKTIDLGKWLNEDYRIPAEDSAEDEPEDENGKDVRH